MKGQTSIENALGARQRVWEEDVWNLRSIPERRQLFQGPITTSQFHLRPCLSHRDGIDIRSPISFTVHFFPYLHPHTCPDAATTSSILKMSNSALSFPSNLGENSRTSTSRHLFQPQRQNCDIISFSLRSESITPGSEGPDENLTESSQAPTDESAPGPEAAAAIQNPHQRPTLTLTLLKWRQGPSHRGHMYPPHYSLTPYKTRTHSLLPGHQQRATHMHSIESNERGVFRIQNKLYLSSH